MRFKKNILLSLFTVIGLFCSAQTKTHYTKAEMKRNAVWIEMIKSENVNYFEALKAFELYFTKHKYPVMEEEEMGKNTRLIERIEKHQKKLAKKKHKVSTDPTEREKEKHEKTKLAFEVKKFNHWEMQTRPYVKEDGTIMSTEERMAIWKNQKGN